MEQSSEKARRIVEAATSLFSRYGFRRTSMDLVAQEAGVAKPTVYAYFDDKEALFRAVVAQVCEQLLAGAAEASRKEGPLAERVAAMLSAKFTRYWELVRASPHAQELLGSQESLGAETVQRFDKAFLELLCATLREGSRELDLERAGLTVPSLAALLLRAASGADYDATSAATHRKHLAELTRVVLLGLERRGRAR